MMGRTGTAPTRSWGSPRPSAVWPAMLYYGYDVTLIPWLIAVGTATHLAGDMLTNEGIPIAWPLSRRHIRLLPGPRRPRLAAG